MDVQSTQAAAPPAAPVAAISVVAPGAPAANAGGVPADGIAPVAAVGPLTPENSNAQPVGTDPGSALAPAIAKLFGGGSSPTPLNLNVSYKVVDNIDEIVTVFSDPQTGREIAQFPSQILVGLAEFFDQARGATLDRSA